ncbi:hypothetical protein HPC49_40155 [Pyxidicoccus fallax]|uniref:Immunity MXAN-0049 protein domain-containing protein n=1 Tax=Pyxidicoccus fallax TaxID=394095 RepID=A0A848LSZ1_9BACT|nr:DUF1629 domain-containing protein [Pyxidicoccus fallax]NMO20514.1 hypothetical protein [Pyxidicoccus fallax]NPC84414.1 hypothetical protein [Pyxidicoccus fallax]
MRYFELLDDVYRTDRWELGKLVTAEGEIVVPGDLMDGVPFQPIGGLRVSIKIPGPPMDFSHAAFSVPIVNARVASILTELATQDVQLIPVDIDNQPGRHFVLNALHVLKCIDDEASTEVQYWTEEDGLPEKVGQYCSVHGMRLDVSKVGEARVFRPWGWSSSLIVAEDIKEALEGAGITGTRFIDVTGPAAPDTQEDASEQRHLARLRQMDEARDAAWRSMGALEAAAIIPIIPSGPYWPGHRQAWRVIRRESGNTLLVTDGLSDPFIDREELSPGFGLELAIETSEPLPDVRGSWQLRLLREVADEVAEHENVRAWLHKGLMSMEVSGDAMPEPLVTREGRVAVLLGLEASTLPRRLPTPAGDVLLVTLKALMPAELDFLLTRRDGKGELARRFAQESDAPHVSRSWRKPVV